MTDIDVTADLGVAGTYTQNGDERYQRLAEATSKLRGRTALGPDKWFQLIGGVLLSVGLMAIIAGWYGASHTTREWRQTPYVVSGGLLGLGLIFIGGFAYFSYWMTRVVEESRVQTMYLESIENLLRQQVESPAVEQPDGAASAKR